MVPKSFLSVHDVSPQELVEILDAAREVKQDPHRFARTLEGRHIGLVFEKHSTRTRLSFEVAVASMGGSCTFLDPAGLQLARGESVEDTARIFGRYLDAVVIRTFSQSRLERIADASGICVVNALTDEWHPCQTLADLQTIREAKGSLVGLKGAFLGDGNNVGSSFMVGAAMAGMDVTVVSPSGYEPSDAARSAASTAAAATGARVDVTDSVDAGVAGADVLYTDVWVGMHQENDPEELQRRHEHLRPYQVNEEMLAKAASDAIVMHCLPARRGEEVTAEVLDGPASRVWDQAENRLHTSKALLRWLLAASS